MIKSHYNRKKFLEERYGPSFLLQMKLINNAKGSTVLEIGPGISFSARNMREIGYVYHTVDIKDRHSPTYLLSFDDLNPEDLEVPYTTVVAFQVLEHIPYDKAIEWLAKMKEIAITTVIISVPYYFSGTEDTHVEWDGRNDKTRKVTRDFTPKNAPDRGDGHIWELGRAGRTIESFAADIESTGLKIVKQQHSPHPYHYFYVCEV